MYTLYSTELQSSCQAQHNQYDPDRQPDHIPVISPLPSITKAVIVCIHYFKTRGQLPGHNSQGIAAFLQEVYGCPRENLVILDDKYCRPTSQPTKKAILQSLIWLVHGCNPGDHLFFYSCGHGQPDKVIFPIDFRENGSITESEIEIIMAQGLRPGIKATVVTDYYSTDKESQKWFDHLTLK